MCLASSLVLLLLLRKQARKVVEGVDRKRVLAHDQRGSQLRELLRRLDLDFGVDDHVAAPRAPGAVAPATSTRAAASREGRRSSSCSILLYFVGAAADISSAVLLSCSARFAFCRPLYRLLLGGVDPILMSFPQDARKPAQTRSGANTSSTK